MAREAPGMSQTTLSSVSGSPAGSPATSLATPYEDERLQRMPGTTALSHFMLQRMMTYHDVTSVRQVQKRLSTQEPKEQVHFLMRILPQRLREELRAEQQVRGERQGDPFYAGEVIGPPLTSGPCARNLQRCRQQGLCHARPPGDLPLQDGRMASLGPPDWDHADWREEKLCCQKFKICPGSGHLSSLPMAWPSSAALAE